MFQQTGAEILFTFYPILGLSGSPDSSTNSLREICLPNQKLVKKCRDAQRAEENNNNKKKKLQKKKRDQKNTGKKKEKRRRRERENSSLACSGCNKPEGRDEGGKRQIKNE